MNILMSIVCGINKLIGFIVSLPFFCSPPFSWQPIPSVVIRRSRSVVLGTPSPAYPYSTCAVSHFIVCHLHYYVCLECIS